LVEIYIRCIILSILDLAFNEVIFYLRVYWFMINVEDKVAIKIRIMRISMNNLIEILLFLVFEGFIRMDLN